MGEASPRGPSANHPARGGQRAVHRHSLRSVPTEGERGRITPGYRVWLHVDGVRMFGPGTYALLRQVSATGSLHQAAKHLGMSYTKAWHLLRETEEHLGWPLVACHVGGALGGGSSLTPKGRELVERFEAFMDQTDDAIQDAFRAAFGDWLSGQLPEE